MSPNIEYDLNKDDITDAEGVGQAYNSNTHRKSLEQEGATATNNKDDKSDTFLKCSHMSIKSNT